VSPHQSLFKLAGIENQGKPWQDLLVHLFAIYLHRVVGLVEKLLIVLRIIDMFAEGWVEDEQVEEVPVPAGGSFRQGNLPPAPHRFVNPLLPSESTRRSY
jgi:hypothetical protein